MDLKLNRIRHKKYMLQPRGRIVRAVRRVFACVRDIITHVSDGAQKMIPDNRKSAHIMRRERA